MTSMIERVAMAITERTQGPWRYIPQEAREAFLSDARAAILAMREPTEGMIAAGEPVPGYPGFCDEPGEPPEREEIYSAMIDAALAEEPK